MTDKIDITRELYPDLFFEPEDTDNLLIMDIEERRKRLSRFAREYHTASDGRIIRTHNIQAIQELNKMDNVYKAESGNGITTINILVPGQDTALLMAGLQQRIAGHEKKDWIEGEIVKEGADTFFSKEGEGH